jgi:hypothetical protein
MRWVGGKPTAVNFRHILVTTVLVFFFVVTFLRKKVTKKPPENNIQPVFGKFASQQHCKVIAA